ncbi:Uncharacterized protein JIP4 [Cyberlindnera fabianii]|uniref:Uncharacterized protein JIP4 n=1 Tax=Cyberlindnera fabianii TaxID=36022 RepID=A0A1V2LAY9_CYBFA|nr:Uncharacterized protein JIP4 [Cyberlindnera fabianii]
MGDELIIVSRVPKMFLDEYDYDETEAMFKETVERIADYVHNICNPKLSFKLNIDIFIHEHTKKTLAETIAIYEPHLLVVVNKPNSRFLEPSSWNMTSRLSHKILKDFAIPVIIVPALTTNECSSKPMKKGIFEDNLLKVSDAIADVAAKMKEASENGDVTELVRSITGMPQLSKIKSMLDVIEPSRDPINKIKNQLSHSTTNSPLMTPTPPQPSNLPDRSKVSVNSTNSDLRRIKSNASICISHDTGTTQRRAKLHKSKSESVVPTNSNSRGSKKFSLKSLFGKK